MATKTISIMEDAYEMLRNLKKTEESFSDVIRRIAGKKNNIMRFAGAWSDISDKEIKAMKKDIENMRKKSTKTLLKKVENI